MGTVLQHPLNSFTTLLKNYDVVNKRFSNSYTRTNYDCKLGIQTSSKLFLELMDRDSVKKMMLKQEEIFRQQVRDLHRLYQAQKQLMADIRSDEATPTSFCHDNRHQSASQSSSEDNRLNQYESWENTCFEGPSGKPKGLNLEQPAVETTDESLAHDQDTSLWRHLRHRTTIEGPDTDVELTLSIGCGADEKKPKHRLHLDCETGCSVSDPSETKQLTPVGQDRREEDCDFPVSSKEESLQGPRRDFQGLSLNFEEEMNSKTRMRR